MLIPRGPITVALVLVMALGAIALALDASTIRIAPAIDLLHPVNQVAYPGERIHVELATGWTPVRSSDPADVVHLGGDWFVAATLGRATLSAASIRCPRCEMATILWRVEIDVRLPGT